MALISNIWVSILKKTVKDAHSKTSENPLQNYVNLRCFELVTQLKDHNLKLKNCLFVLKIEYGIEELFLNDILL